MGRSLRCHAPGTIHLVTSRCHQARFFLRPDRPTNRAVLEWLARAQHAWPGVRLLGVCVMSNHIHLLVQDTQGDLAGWASYFFGNLARAVNRIRGRSGAVFSRRYSAEPVLDDGALLDRLVYVVTNPVQARLCARARDWPGVVLWSRSGEVERHQISWVEGDATESSGTETLEIHPLPLDDARTLVTAIRQREAECRIDRRRAGVGVMTRAQLVSQHWHSRPRWPKNSPRPLCHTTDPALRRAFVERVGDFATAFREAAARLRAGLPDIIFPPWSYPPGAPIVRAEA